MQSGVLARDGELDANLSGGGLTFNAPGFEDLANEAEDIADDTGGNAVPSNIASRTEIAVRLSRSKSWGASDLSSALAGADPMEAIANRVAFYWSRRSQAAFISTVLGILADNIANDSGDYEVNIGSTAGVSAANFSASAVLDAMNLMGDSMDDLALVMTDSFTYTAMQKANLVTEVTGPFGVSDSVITVPTYLGKLLIVDDTVPTQATVNDHRVWLFGAGAFGLGMSDPKNPVEVERFSLANQGSGEEVLTSRVEWAIHPRGHAYTGTPAANGGPTNTELEAATSFDRRAPERKQIKFAQLVYDATAA